MNTFTTDIITKIRKYSQKTNNLSILANQPWVVFNDVKSIKTVWIFRNNNNFIIAKNGIVEKGTWEFINSNSFLISISDTHLYLNHCFLDDSILALKIDNNNEYAFFINENKSKHKFNSLDDIVAFLEARYLNIHKNHIEICKSYFEKNKHNYKAPEFEVIKRRKYFSLIDLNSEVIKVKYADGVTGSIYKKGKTGHAFFKIGYSVTAKFCSYRDFNSCVNSLHYYITQKKNLKLLYWNSFFKRILFKSGYGVKVGYWYARHLSRI